MKKDANLSPVDRTVRVVLGVVLLGIGVFVVQGGIGIGLAVIGGVLIFSGAIGFCHVYQACGICTAKKA